MIKSVIALSAILTLGSIAAALAQDNNIQGTIQSIDSANRTVTLDNGQTVKLGPSADMSRLRAGGTIDETCAGGTVANCSLMQPDTQNPAAQQTSPENQTAPSAGSNSTTNPPPSNMGTGNTTGSSSGTSGTDGSNGTGTGGSSGSGSGSGGN
jgi:type II secretory pathway pseudopilin PulG